MIYEYILYVIIRLYICVYIQGLTKVWKPLNNFWKNENIKKR